MSLSRLRLITFDVKNTLLKFRTSPGKQYGEIGALFGVRCDNNDLARNFKISWYNMNRAHPNFGCYSKLGWQNWWQELIADTFSASGSKIPDDKIEKLSNYLIDMYKCTACWQHCNGSIELLNYLEKQKQLRIKNIQNHPNHHIALGVISNFDPRLDTLLRNMKIDHFFDFVLNSYESKMEKPNSDFFKLAMRCSKINDLKPEECLHIGDSPTTDYLGAKNAGWNAALIHEKDTGYLFKKYGEKLDESYCFFSLFDFHKKLSNNFISW